MNWLLQLMGSGILKVFGDAILTPIMGVLNKRVDAETERQKGVLALVQDDNRQRQETYRLMWGWWGTRWLLIAAALPAVIHSGAIYLDSTFRFGWAIARAPGIYEGMEVQIVLGACGIQATSTLVGGLISTLRK